MTNSVSETKIKTLARPLYLEPGRPARVEMDGPAIKIILAGRKASYLPLRLVSRITLNHRVRFDSSLITACAERGIILLIKGNDGTPLARLLTIGQPPSSTLQRMFDMTERPDWRECYEAWRYAMQRRISRTLTSRLRAPSHLYAHPTELQKWINHNAVYLSDPLTAKRAQDKLKEMAYNWAYLRLQQEGLDARSETLRAETPDIASDMADLLALRLETERVKLLKKRHRLKVHLPEHEKPLSDEIITRVYECDAPKFERLGQDIYNRWHRWLIELDG